MAAPQIGVGLRAFSYHVDDEIGYVRLLGIVHVILWTPLFVYLLRRAWHGEMRPGFRVVMWLFVVSLAISLVFDYVDVVRYLLGERASMV